MQRKIISDVSEVSTSNMTLPKRVDRKVGAQLVSQHYFPISPRTLECWPLTWQRLNGRALVETAELLCEARRRVSEAPRVRGGN